MKEIDRMIQEALRAENSEMLEKFSEDQTVHEMITDLFRIRPRWLLVGTILVTLASIVVAAYAGYRFYYAPEMREMPLWGALGSGCITVGTAVKIWGWMEMSKNAVIREIKRLELQIVYLSGKIYKQHESE